MSILSEDSARILAMRKKREFLGEYIYTQTMAAETLLETLLSKYPQLKDSNEYQDLMDKMSAIQTYLEEFP